MLTTLFTVLSVVGCIASAGIGHRIHRGLQQARAYDIHTSFGVYKSSVVQRRYQDLLFACMAGVVLCGALGLCLTRSHYHENIGIGAILIGTIIFWLYFSADNDRIVQRAQWCHEDEERKRQEEVHLRDLFR